MLPFCDTFVLCIIITTVLLLTSRTFTRKNPNCNPDTDACYCVPNSVDLSNRKVTHKMIRKITIKNDTICINLNNNDIQELAAEDLVAFPRQLEKVYFKNCAISKIKSDNIFNNLKKLKLFDISYNNLTAHAFQNLFKSIGRSNIQSLDISGNKLDSIFNLSFSFMDSCNVSVLQVNDCALTNISNIIKTNKTRKHLMQIDLERNLITEDDLETFHRYGEYYPMLKGLKLSSNPIKHLDQNIFSKLPALKRLWIADLDTKSLNYKGVNCSKLKFLNISNSFLFTPRESIFSFTLTPNISILILSNTRLSKWTSSDLFELLSPLQNLQTLTISKTSLFEIPLNLFNRLRSLIVLDLSANEIVDWPTTCFQNISTKFKKLYLSDNRIKTIQETSFPPEFLKQLKKLHLNGNNFQCDCSIHWFRFWMKKHYNKLDALSPEHLTFRYTCESPDHYKNKLLIDFDPDYEDCLGLTMAVLITLFICGFCVVSVITLNIAQTLYSV